MSGIRDQARPAAATFISGDGTNETVDGLDGNGTLRGFGGADDLTGGEGNDLLDGGAGIDTMTGGIGNDTYVANTASDINIENEGEGVSDSVHCYFSYTLGDNLEWYGLANYTLSANIENGQIYDPGNFNMNGNALDNTLLGNDQANILDGKGGGDEYFGGGGNDIFYINSTGDVIFESSGGGTDTVRAYYSYTLGANVENLTLIGTSASTLTGNAQANTIIGNGLANTINGKLGNDILTGGAGPDIFVLGNTPSSVNRDTITDDTIHLENAIFAVGAAGALNPNAFHTGTAAHDADDRIIYNATTGALIYDSDGNGAGGAIQIAPLDEGLEMNSEYFGVI